MKIIAIATALFVALAGATEQGEQAQQGELSSQGRGGYRPDRWDDGRRRRRGGRRRGGRRRGRGRYDGRNWNPNDGGGDFGYSDSCSCAVNGVIDTDIARQACNDLQDYFPNLQFDDDSGACYDDNDTGIENNGWGAACQNRAPAYDVWNPAYVTSTCDPNSPDDYDY